MSDLARYSDLDTRRFGKRIYRADVRTAADVNAIENLAAVEEVDMMIVRCPAGEIRTVHALEASGYKGQGGTAILSHPQKPDYFRDVCKGFAARGRLRILALEAGDTTLAMKCQMGAGDGIFELKVAFDERFAPSYPAVIAGALRAPPPLRGYRMRSAFATDGPGPQSNAHQHRDSMALVAFTQRSRTRT